MLSHCDVLTVTMWPDLGRAIKEKDLIDRTHCGHACVGDHEIVDMDA